jgi:hypothetical protein
MIIAQPGETATLWMVCIVPGAVAVLLLATGVFLFVRGIRKQRKVLWIVGLALVVITLMLFLGLVLILHGPDCGFEGGPL